jgi:Thioredoxin
VRKWGTDEGIDDPESSADTKMQSRHACASVNLQSFDNPIRRWTLPMRFRTLQLVEPVGRTDHSIGPRDAPVTVVEYGDFECPKCKQAAGAVKLLIARFGERIRFVFRHFPQNEIHPHALQAAEVAECAGGQARFWQMHDLQRTSCDRVR